MVEMPARRVTNVCFGGSRLDTLYVTTSRAHLPEDELSAGRCRAVSFCFDPKVTGFEKHAFAADGTR